MAVQEFASRTIVAGCSDCLKETGFKKADLERLEEVYFAENFEFAEEFGCYCCGGGNYDTNKLYKISELVAKHLKRGD